MDDKAAQNRLDLGCKQAAKRLEGRLSAILLSRRLTNSASGGEEYDLARPRLGLISGPAVVLGLQYDVAPRFKVGRPGEADGKVRAERSECDGDQGVDDIFDLLGT